MTRAATLIPVVLFVFLSSSTASVRVCGAGETGGVGESGKEQIQRVIDKIVRESPSLADPGWDDDLWTNKEMKELVRQPGRFRDPIEQYLLGPGKKSDAAIRVAVLAVQCLPLGDYIAFVGHLAGVGKGQVSGRALLYGIVPGSEWSTRIQLGYDNPGIKELLLAVKGSPNADKNVRSIVDHILAGQYARDLRRTGKKPNLRCDGTGQTESK
jgi:hypothetical protein